MPLCSCLLVKGTSYLWSILLDPNNSTRHQQDGTVLVGALPLLAPTALLYLAIDLPHSIGLALLCVWIMTPVKGMTFSYCIVLQGPARRSCDEVNESWLVSTPSCMRWQTRLECLFCLGNHLDEGRNCSPVASSCAPSSVLSFLNEALDFHVQWSSFEPVGSWYWSSFPSICSSSVHMFPNIFHIWQSQNTSQSICKLTAWVNGRYWKIYRVEGLMMVPTRCGTKDEDQIKVLLPR
jgi:hypothetical protein